MASNKDDLGSGPSRPADAPSKRPYATIDVKAHEVGAAETAAGATTSRPAAANAAEAPAQPGPAGTPKRLSAAWEARAKAAAALAALGRRMGTVGFLTHCAAGAAGALLVLFAAQLPGWRAPAAPDIGELTRRLALMEAALRTRQGATADTRAKIEELARSVDMLGETQASLVRDTKALATRIGGLELPPELQERLAKLEQGLAAASGAKEAGQVPQVAASAARLAELEKAVRDTRDSVTSALARLDADLAAGRSDAGRLAQRLATLREETQEQLKGAARAADVTPLGLKLVAMQQELQAILGSEADRAANTSRLVLGLELANLKRAVDRGEDFSAELARIKKTTGSTLNVAALEHFTREGVPSVQELVTSFRATANAMIDAEAQPSDATLFERLLSGARSIVRIRKTGHAAGDNSAEAVVDRMEAALRQGRLGEALGHAKSLPPKAELAGEDWVKRATQRLAVDQALADIEAALATALAGRGSGDAKR